MSPIDLMAQGIHRALADCGLHLRDVDGLLCATTQSRTSGLASERISRHLAGLYRYDDPRRLVLHVSCRARAGGAPARPVQGRGHRLWLTQRTVGRRQASVREYNPYETPFRPFLPVDRLCAGGIAPYAPIRHDPRAIGGGRGGGARMGIAQPGRLGKEAADDRRGVVGAHGQLSRSPCAILSGHRWRRRGDHDHRRARPIAEKAAGLCPRLRPGDHPRQYFEHAGSDGDRGPAVGARGLRDGAARPRRHRRRRAVRRLHDQHDPLPRGSRLLPEGRGRAASSPTAVSRRAAVCRSTPMAAASPIAIPACTDCSC